VDAVEEARGSVEGRGLQGCFDSFAFGRRGGSRGHVQARALSLQLVLARAKSVLDSFSGSRAGWTRRGVVVEALVQPVHVIGMCGKGCIEVVSCVGCVVYSWCMWCACDLLCWRTASYFQVVCANAGSRKDARGDTTTSQI
jgi:hypothetical protein